MTEQTKKRISLAKMGSIPWNKGKKGLQVAWNKGLTKKTDPRLKHKYPTAFSKGSQLWLGKTHSEATKVKIGISKKGNTYRRGKTSSNRGEKHPNWKGGITPFEKAQRVEFRQKLQKFVFQRDNYTCQMCGSKKDLQVDHIQPWAEYVEGRFDINNCRTLCAKCHYKITFGKPMPESTQAWGHNLLKGAGLS